MKEYDLRKLEVEELKKKLIEYFRSEKSFDSTLSLILEELKLGLKNLDLLEYCLSELVEEGWIKKSKSFDHNEYDPGEELEGGRIQG